VNERLERYKSLLVEKIFINRCVLFHRVVGCLLFELDEGMMEKDGWLCIGEPCDSRANNSIANQNRELPTLYFYSARCSVQLDSNMQLRLCASRHSVGSAKQNRLKFKN
jgi:hypothetical protein